MRRFRLKRGNGYANVTEGNIYDYDEIISDLGKTVLHYVETFPEDWQEVFDEPKPPHKNTDLGWAVSVLLRSGWNIHEVVKDAKELIKQLNEEGI